MDDGYTAYLIERMNELVKAAGGYTLRPPTARLWVEVMRAFDESDPPMTVRQVFYALVSRGALPKTEASYNKTVYHLLRMRRCGVLHYDYIADNTRWMRKPDSYTGLQAYLEAGQEAYRRALWANQNAYVELWCEKAALAGVLYDVTARWDVPLMVTRGYPSESFVYEAAEALKDQDKPVFLYYFGDHDPSGKNIPENTSDKLRDFGARFSFEVVAVLPWQIEAWGLPTRPTKRTDTRAKGWRGGSVELDALPVARLRTLARDVIERHIDYDALEVTREAERLERRAFEQINAALSYGPGGQVSIGNVGLG